MKNTPENPLFPNRRTFVKQLAGAAGAFILAPYGAHSYEIQGRDSYGGWTGLRGKATGFFHTEIINGRHWLITPLGNVFLSLGVNHADVSAIQYESNNEIWKEKYGGSRERWIRESVVKDLKDWGFNTIGWTQELVTFDYGHSPQWTHHDYRTADMPYCHLLPFAEIQRYKSNVNYPDVFSKDFEDWCDYIARSQCLEMSEDPNLIGYFYGDVPGWIFNNETDSWAEHLGVTPDDNWEGLRPVAEKYYQVIHDAIRRYDRNHLLLGERYYGPKEIPIPVIEAASKTVDVMCVELFSFWEGLQPVLSHLHRYSGKPVILADFSYNSPSRVFEVPEDRHHFAEDDHECGQMYRENMTKAFAEPYMVGCHLCVYVENHVRMRGLKDHYDRPYEGYVSEAKKFNNDVYNIAKTAK